MHKEPQILLLSTSGKSLPRCLAHPRVHKRELVPTEATPPPPSPPARAVQQLQPTPLHQQRAKPTAFALSERSRSPAEGHPHPNGQIDKSRPKRTPRSRRRFHRAAAARQRQKDRDPPSTALPTEAPHRAERLTSGGARKGTTAPGREAEGAAGSGPGAASPCPPGEATEMKGGAAESQRFRPTLGKASPRQSCLTIKGERLCEQLSSLAGECSNEVRGEGAPEGDGPARAAAGAPG